MKKTTQITILLLSALIHSACQSVNKISVNENAAQLMLGQSTEIVKDVFSKAPDKITGTKESCSALWYYMYKYQRTHYVPGYSYSTSSYNSYTDTLTLNTYSRPGYTYTTPDFDSYMVEVFAKNYRITGVDFTARQATFSTNAWRWKNSVLFDWNYYNANDKLKELKELEQTHPSYATAEMRLKGCLQAAKYDSLDLLIYYLTECKVPLDTPIETWVRGTSTMLQLQDYGCFVLGKASVRDILKERNNEKVLKKLTKLGVL